MQHVYSVLDAGHNCTNSAEAAILCWCVFAAGVTVPAAAATAIRFVGEQFLCDCMHVCSSNGMG